MRVLNESLFIGIRRVLKGLGNILSGFKFII